MPDVLKSRARYALEIALGVIPWLISMFTLYWLQHGGIWTTTTPHRGKLSVAILCAGMALTFLILSHFAARRRQ